MLATMVVVDAAAREAALDREVSKYVRSGYRVVSRTATTAQLVKPKRFNFLIAFIGFMFIVAGLILYVLYYMAQRDQTIYLTVDEAGKVRKQ
jgi:hypothetical protein